MTRFVTKKEQKNINQASSSYLHYLLLILIIMEFIRLPDVFELPPVYLVTGFGLFFIILFDLKKISTISPIIIKIILLLLFYNVYSFLLFWGLDIQNEKLMTAARDLGGSVKKFIQLLLFSLACSNLVELRRVIFTITITIFFSAAFGLLIYHFGEPFQGIRDWLWQSRFNLVAGVALEDSGGKGQFVTGLSGTHWLFGPLMAAGPALALICGRLSRFKWPWAVIFLLMWYALYLNAERAPFACSCLAITALLIYWHLVSILTGCIGVTFVLSIYMFSFGNTQNIQSPHIYREELTFFDRLSHSGRDSEDRFTWWKAAVTSTIESPWRGPTKKEYGQILSNSKSAVVRQVPWVHNAYIATGLHIGIIGWIIVLFYLIMFKKVLTQVFTAATEEPQEKIIFQGTSITVLAPMLNAMVQNESIFNAEPTTVCLTGLLISCYQISYHRNAAKLNYHSSKNKYA